MPISTHSCAITRGRASRPAAAPRAPMRRSKSSACAAASPKIWPRRKRHIPHFTYVEEIDVTELEDMRGDLNANRGRPAQADHAAADDRRDLQGAARFPDDQCAL